jgi:hypothetical protein
MDIWKCTKCDETRESRRATYVKKGVKKFRNVCKSCLYSPEKKAAMNYEKNIRKTLKPEMTPEINYEKDIKNTLKPDSVDEERGFTKQEILMLKSLLERLKKTNFKKIKTKRIPRTFNIDDGLLALMGERAKNSDITLSEFLNHIIQFYFDQKRKIDT